ncbi:MAG: NADH-quinone oxidoreductase subunit NuoE [Polyangiales bacterium]
MSFELTPAGQQTVAELLTRYPTKRAACLPVLHLCQRQLGWVSPEVIEFVAERLEMPIAAVKGVVTFYTSLFQQPVAPNVIWVCRTLSCELRGARLVQEHLEQRLQCKVGETSPDGKFSLRKAECLAACGYGPMVQIGDQYHENLTIEALDRILDGLAGETQSAAGDGMQDAALQTQSADTAEAASPDVVAPNEAASPNVAVQSEAMSPDAVAQSEASAPEAAPEPRASSPATAPRSAP